MHIIKSPIQIDCSCPNMSVPVMNYRCHPPDHRPPGVLRAALEHTPLLDTTLYSGCLINTQCIMMSTKAPRILFVLVLWWLCCCLERFLGVLSQPPHPTTTHWHHPRRSCLLCIYSYRHCTLSLRIVTLGSTPSESDDVTPCQAFTPFCLHSTRYNTFTVSH